MQRTTPDPSWAGIKKILIVSDFRSGHVIRPELSAEILCKRVQAIAAAGSPAPVKCTGIGDPNLSDSDAAVLIVQAAVREPRGADALLVFAVRRQRAQGLEPAPVYFGAGPQAVSISKGIDFAAIDTAIRQSLGEILPWLHQREQQNETQLRRGE